MTEVWFKGPIAEAVSAVTQKNLLFLVYIYDDSEESKQLETTLNDDKLTPVMKQKTIALKMQKDSDDAKMFGQLYPISKVPVVYFILQGTIKDFGIQDLTSDEIIKRINNLCPNNSAKEKLEEIRKKRAEEGKEQARERELKRREEGKLAQDTQQNLQEKQTKLHLEKAKKEKHADEEYKKKVKEQIAKDRANQIASRKAKKQEGDNKQKAKEVSSSSSGSSGYYDHSNLNIKQLDGTSLRHNFSSSGTLASVSQWIDSTRTDGDMPFKLFAQFPNRNFDIGDERRTLLALKLCPSGTLIMKPIRNASTAYSGSSNATSTSGWMNYIYSASDIIYNSVSSVGTSVASYLVTPTATPEHGQRLGGNTNATSASTSSGPRNSGNINTLNSAKYKKNDDDRQTYNGNSVNQE